jgi:CHAT domain-containing protein
VVVANTDSPAALLLDRLTPWRGRREGAVVLERGEATLTRVRRELPSATEIEFYTHGIQKLNDAEGAYLVLTPDAALKGEYRLTAADVRALSLDGAPYVYLKACVTADAGLQNDTNRSLASAFVERGARAVFASTVSIPDVDADRFFNAIREQIRQGASPAAALFNAREAARQGEDAEAQSWMDDVVCLQPG